MNRQGQEAFTRQHGAYLRGALGSAFFVNQNGPIEPSKIESRLIGEVPRVNPLQPAKTALGGTLAFTRRIRREEPR